MKLSQLQAIVAVAEWGSFSGAALHLQLSQSAISHAIATLEDELGVPLFSRGRYGAVVTPAGERIVAQAQQALRHLELMQQEANLQRGLYSGQVRVASFRSVATHILPKVIAQFRDRHPTVSVTIIERPDYLDIERCVREGRAEIGITYLPTRAEFRVWELLRDEYVVLLPPNAVIKGDRLTWNELATYPSVQLPCLPCGRMLHQFLKTNALPMQTACDIQEDSTIVGLVKQGLGVAILPRLAAEPIPTGIQIHSLPERYERVIGVAVLETALHVPAVFAFLEQLQQFDLTSIASIPSQ
jgi:DNA-binding transcriptional LysR family regulator